MEGLREVAERLRAAKVEFALGGSGLLSFFGFKGEIGDWDLTTDAPIEEVRSALTGFDFEELGPKGLFVSKYLFKITRMNSSIDLMGGFALRRGDQIHAVPTIVTADWDGIPIGSPEAWLRVYEITGHQEKASFLRRVLGG